MATRPPNELADATLPNALTGGAGAPVAPVAPRAGAVTTRGTPARTSALATKAAAEYVYVGQDLRHIVLMAGVLGAILAVLFVLIDVMRVIQL